jgi:MFS family permease
LRFAKSRSDVTAAYLLVPVNCASALSAGVVLALVAAVKQALAQRLGRSEDHVDTLGSWLQLALVLTLPVAGLAVDRLGVEHVLIASSLLAGFSLSLLALRESLALARLALLLLGAAAAGLLVGAIVLLPATFAARHPGAAVNLGMVFVGLGFVLTPVLVDLLQSRLRLRRALLLLALVCLTPALTAALTPGDEWPTPLPPADWRQVFTHPIMGLSALLFIFYAPLEAALTNWAAKHLTELGLRERQVRWLMIGFWTAFLGSRLLMALLISGGALPVSAHSWIILGLGLSLGIGLGNMVGSGHRAGAGWGLLVVGFFCGPLLPTMLGILLAGLPNEPGTAVGTAWALGALTSLLLAPVIALLARRSSVQRALRIPLISALLLAGVALVLSLTK